MKRFLSLLLLFMSPLFGNAGVFRGHGNTVVLDSTAEIQMVEETVTMTPMRGNYPVDGHCRNLDPMEFHCVFKLRNLSEQTVTVPVGFPISGEHYLPKDKAKINQPEIIAQFAFVAGTKEYAYPVRYVPFDKKEKFSNIFVWDMTFQPRQEIELFVCYQMHGYFGVMNTRKKDKREASLEYWKKFPQQELIMKRLENAVGQAHMYVTETGKCWAGKIEKATFRIYPFDFEEYLARRGVSDKRASRKDEAADMLTTAPMLRHWSPEYSKWNLVKDKRNRNLYLELAYAPFEPKNETDNLQFMYIFPLIPTTVEQFDRLLLTVKKEMDKDYAMRDKMLERWKNKKDDSDVSREQTQNVITFWQDLKPYSAAVERNFADAVLEFYGVRRDNPQIKDFLERQCWYPAEAREIDPQLKKRLLNAGKETD